MGADRSLKLTAAVLALAAGVTVAGASSHPRRHHDEGEREEARDDRPRRGRGRGDAAAAMDPAYAKECGACHLPYPPALLPPASWRALLASLGDHFGDDAELAPEVRARLEGWLVASAGEQRPPGARAPLRVTETDGFRREHREVPRDAAARPSIRTMANCAACHPRADAWDFEEDDVRIPRG
jgi:hypothetical protein